MKRSEGSSRRRRRPTPPHQRAELLAAFERSGMSATAFAREHGVRYTTFCNWRRGTKRQPSPGFVQIELPETTAPAELLIELGAHARLRITSARQLELAAQLLRHLNSPAAC